MNNDYSPPRWRLLGTRKNFLVLKSLKVIGETLFFTPWRCRYQRAFTLIELMVTVGIIGLVVVSATGLFFFTLKGGKKADIQSKIKQNGDYAINVMKTMIRNAEQINPPCASSMTSIEIKNPDGGSTTFNISSNQVASSGAGLTSNEFVASGLTFNCDSPVDKPPTVSLSFTLSKSGIPEESISQTFQTSVSLRSY